MRWKNEDILLSNIVCGLGRLLLSSASLVMGAEQLAVFMQPEYIDQEVVDGFEKRDIKIKFGYSFNPIGPEQIKQAAKLLADNDRGNLEYIRDLGPAKRLDEEAWAMTKTR